MSLRRLILCGFITLNAIGCGTVQFDAKQPDEAPTALATQGYWQHIFLFGFWNTDAPVKLEQACPDQDWQQVKMERTGLQTLISASLIYTPATIFIDCERRQE